MTDITKGEVNNSAQVYVVNPANTTNYTGGAPYAYGHGLTARHDLLDPNPNPPAAANIAASLGAAPDDTQLITAARNLAKHYARIVRGIYGVTGNSGAWHAYEIFFVQPGYHAAHYNSLVAAIDSAPTSEIAGNVNLANMRTYFTRLFNLVNSYKNNQEVDLRVCHGSCHSNCHSSRGRR